MDMDLYGATMKLHVDDPPHDVLGEFAAGLRRALPRKPSSEPILLNVLRYEEGVGGNDVLQRPDWYAMTALPIYFLGLEASRTSADLAAARHAGWRFYLSDRPDAGWDGITTTSDVALEESSSRFVAVDSGPLARTSAAVLQALEAADDSAETFAARVLEVPALDISALWLVPNDVADDVSSRSTVITILGGWSGIDTGTQMSEQDFAAELRRIAAKQFEAPTGGESAANVWAEPVRPEYEDA